MISKYGHAEFRIPKFPIPNSKWIRGLPPHDTTDVVVVVLAVDARVASGHINVPGVRSGILGSAPIVAGLILPLFSSSKILKKSSASYTRNVGRESVVKAGFLSAATKIGKAAKSSW